VKFAGQITTEDPVYIVGGPMMGFVGTASMPITKTTNAILVMPSDHKLVQRTQSSSSIELKRAASICCQCEECTNLCPRNMLGHPIEPHLFMRSAANQDFQNLNIFLDTFFCCSCGICELFACPQGLAPRTLITIYKNGLKKAGVKPPADILPTAVNAAREYRKVPEKRLEARLGLAKYNKPAPLDDQTVSVKTVVEKMSQHIGVPAVPAVTVGMQVKRGDVIGKAAEGLSVAIHASINGKVTAVNKNSVTIQSVG